MKLYTKTGDTGKTHGFKGQRTKKNSCLIEMTGKLDALQAQLDKCSSEAGYRDFIREVQKALRHIGGEVLGYAEPYVTDRMVKEVEDRIDRLSVDMKMFIYFNSRTAMEFNEARIRCREFERCLVDSEASDTGYQFINRLSDLLFAIACDYETQGMESSSYGFE